MQVHLSLKYKFSNIIIYTHLKYEDVSKWGEITFQREREAQPKVCRCETLWQGEEAMSSTWLEFKIKNKMHSMGGLGD